MKIEAEDFAVWRDNPVTEAVTAHLKRKAEECKERWLAESWGKGECNPLLLADLRATERILNDLANLSHEDIQDEE